MARSNLLKQKRNDQETSALLIDALCVTLCNRAASDPVYAAARALRDMIDPSLVMDGPASRNAGDLYHLIKYGHIENA